MEITLYLSQVLGLALVILGALLVIRRAYFIPVFAGLADQRLLRTVIAVVELLGGLFLVAAHNVWSSPAAAIVSLLGWVAAIEGALWLALPDAWIRKALDIVNRPLWYRVGGLLSVALGVYLAGFGFGLW